MPTNTQTIALRRAIRQGYVGFENGEAVIQENAPPSVRAVFHRANVRRPRQAFTPVFHELIRDSIRQKYDNIGGYSSPLGLPVDATMPIQETGGTFYVEFRGGTIEATTLGDPVAYEERVVKVIWTALECQVRQESEDEVYGTVGGLRTADGAVTVTNFPESGGYWSLGKSGNRVVLPNTLVYKGPPSDIVVAATLIEHDSGDIEGVKQKIAAKLAEVARGLAGVAGVPAETLGSDQGWLDDLSLGLVNAISDFLGAADDAYVPQTLRLSWADLISQNYTLQHGSRGDDPRAWDYTHYVVLSGTDEGGDTGHYGFYFKVEQEVDGHRRLD